MQSFEIPKNVGGRFSVFCAVGLLPLAIVGIDIDEILAGAKKIYDDFFQQKDFYKRIVKKARFLVEYKYSFNINVVFSYSSRLEGFNKWYIQLWGESLGKVDINNTHQGLTPIGIIGPIDQHSFLQLIVEGRRDKTVTVVKVQNFDNDLKIPQIKLEGLEDLDYINGIAFSELINKQADATIESINNLSDIPCDVITIDGVTESAIAALMYEYEILTSLCAKFMYIDAYNQPGVEAGKIILKKKLQ
jgi:glucose-6-phosphate isomerase